MLKLYGIIGVLLSLFTVIGFQYLEVKSLKSSNSVLESKLVTTKIDLTSCESNFKALASGVSTQNEAITKLAEDKANLETSVKLSYKEIQKMKLVSNSSVEKILHETVKDDCKSSLEWLTDRSINILKDVK
jgi:hypothetical protein